MRPFKKPMKTWVQAKSAFRKSSDLLQLDYIAMRNWEVMNSKRVGPPWDFACWVGAEYSAWDARQGLETMEFAFSLCRPVGDFDGPMTLLRLSVTVLWAPSFVWSRVLARIFCSCVFWFMVSCICFNFLFIFRFNSHSLLLPDFLFITSRFADHFQS